MSLDLVVANSISSGSQTVQDQNGASSALSLATNQVTVKGQDIVGGALPLILQGSPVGTGQQTWGRIIRLVGFAGSATFFDIGIDQNGNLFLNGPNSTQTNHIITISPNGTITIP